MGLSFKGNVSVENHIEEFINAILANQSSVADAMGAAAVDAIQKTIIEMGAVRTGELLNSISYTVDGNSVEIGSGCDHAVYVHEGTSRMAGRPFMEEGIRDESIVAAAIEAIQSGV